MQKWTLMIGLCLCASGLSAQNKSNHGNKFEQLDYLLQSPNEYRTASGAPSPKYWQQRADYDITAELDEKNRRITGSETITYYNNSPNPLSYIWLQLDENQHDPKADNNYFNESSIQPTMNEDGLYALEPWRRLEGLGDKIMKITDINGKPLIYTINQTMMRIELPQTLNPSQRFIFKVDWHYNIPNRLTIGGRGGYEYFPEDGNCIFTITQWYPRLCVYSDFQGWQNHQFTGRAEFALTFGNFRVNMTVPADHIVTATGECQNYNQTLSSSQMARWKQAQNTKEPVEIVTLQEATAAEKQQNATKKTWIFQANNVRDFAWTSSRKFIWDAMPTYVEGKKIMCMSFYPKEAYALYKKYSTKIVAHTVKTYSKYTIPYPYPVAQSIEAANGMEYPMICFNFGRTEKDGTYTEATKNGMIMVIIHEVGHNFFPMIVNSDERQWTWMDEGINTFCQYLTEQAFDNNYPSSSGPAYKIVDYMKLPKDQLEPIMTNSENIVRFGPNAYSKPATALNILRETIMGRALFDYAFKEYARRWAFKHPTPADFFRTIQDASGVDLNWFWRGWFFSIDAVDISLDDVKYYRLATTNNKDVFVKREEKDISQLRNKEINMPFTVESDTALQDFYYHNPTADQQYKLSQPNPLTDNEAAAHWVDKYFYELSFSNRGGLVMPIIIEWTFKDGTTEIQRIPVQIWRKNEQAVTKAFIKDKEVQAIRLDPMRETADINENNNIWPLRQMPSRFELFKSKATVRSGGNAMQKRDSTLRH